MSFLRSWCGNFPGGRVNCRCRCSWHFHVWQLSLPIYVRYCFQLVLTFHRHGRRYFTADFWWGRLPYQISASAHSETEWLKHRSPPSETKGLLYFKQWCLLTKMPSLNRVLVFEGKDVIYKICVKKSNEWNFKEMFGLKDQRQISKSG